uniref:Uncharacterized protein n=1 Tax=Arundo donax TaxID=35708 RepID=A0A0A9D733_ARUDO
MAGEAELGDIQVPSSLVALVGNNSKSLASDPSVLQARAFGSVPSFAGCRSGEQLQTAGFVSFQASSIVDHLQAACNG